MAFEAKVFKILIASPGDVDEERQAIPEVISRWNDANAETASVVLLPVKWETHSAPLLGDRAQGIINDQLVTSCDMAIGVFWTRLGSPTGVSESGTAEEIEWFITNNKPVMVYFSSCSIDPVKLDIDQYKSLKIFEAKMQSLGLTGSYRNIPDFKEQLATQININVRRLLNGEEFKTSSVDTNEKNKTIKKLLKAGKIYMEDYEKDGLVKSFIVKGDTKGAKEDIKRMGGKWNTTLGGWVFPKTKELEVAAFLKAWVTAHP